MKGCVYMSSKSSRYSEEFKSMLVDFHRRGKTLSEIMSEYGLSKSALYKWINERKGIVVNDEQVSATDVIKLKTKIRELEMENDILKKAMTIFAKK